MRALSMILANVVGALGAAFFARAGLEHYQHTHSLIGAAFFAEQLWIVLVYLVRRRAITVSSRIDDWILAFVGTFAGVMLRPSGIHPHWGVVLGLDLQLAGLALCVASFGALGRSFGFAPADRGIKRRGPYALVRHPIYASYLLLVGGYVLQSQSWRNALVAVVIWGSDIGRARAEERHLRGSGPYAEYRNRVRWRFIPRIW